MDNRHLVLGGTGFLGAHLVLKLLEVNKRVSVLYRNEASQEKLKRIFSFYFSQYEVFYEKIEWIKGDITDVLSLDEVITENDIVYHCAAHVSIDKVKSNDIHEINVEGTANVVNICLDKNINKLVYVSSVAAVGNVNNNSVISEDGKWPVNSRGVYSTTKTKAEMEVWRGIAEGLTAVIVNPSVIVGPGEWSVGSPSFFQRVYDGLKMYSGGGTGFVDVHDVCRIMLALADTDIENERFILNGENLSYFDFLGLVAIALNKKAPTKFISNRKLNIAWKIARALSIIGIKPFITKESALAAGRTKKYSSEKVCKFLNVSFKPIKTSVKETAEIFLKDY